MKEKKKKRTIEIVEKEISDKITAKYRKYQKYERYSALMFILAFIALAVSIGTSMFLIETTLSRFMGNVGAVAIIIGFLDAYSQEGKNSGYVTGASDVLNSLSEITDIKKAEESNGKSKKK